jgi:hypothetical protein
MQFPGISDRNAVSTEGKKDNVQLVYFAVSTEGRKDNLQLVDFAVSTGGRKDNVHLVYFRLSLPSTSFTLPSDFYVSRFHLCTAALHPSSISCVQLKSLLAAAAGGFSGAKIRWTSESCET